MTNRISARDMALIAIFAGITAALGLIPAIPTPFSSAPITAQSLGIILAGAILGCRKGGASQTLFIVLVAIGLPLLAGGRGGLGVFATASGGFLIGYAVVPFLIGWFTERVGAPYRLLQGLAINFVFGMVVLYLFGIAGMVLVTRMDVWAAVVAMTPFLIGDTIKVVLATLVARGVHAAYPGLLRPPTTQATAPASETVTAN